MLFQLLYHKFLSQTAVPPLSKATKVARLQLACKPDSSSSQRALLLNVMHLRSSFHLPFPISIISYSHFFIPHSWFYQFPNKLGYWSVTRPFLLVKRRQRQATYCRGSSEHAPTITQILGNCIHL